MTKLNPLGRILPSGSEAIEEYEPPVVDQTKILLENVNESVSDESIRLYITLIFNPILDEQFKIEKIRRNFNRCLVRFNRPFKLKEMLERQSKIPDLAGVNVSFTEVRVPDTVRVTGLTNSCSQEMLNLYFSYPKISGGGDIRNVKMYEYDFKALVQFEDYKRVELVCSRTHSIGGSTIKVEKYFGPIEDEFFFEEEEQESKAFSSSTDQAKSSRGTKSNAYFSLRSFNTPSLVIDRTKLVLSNIQENVSIQQLDFYIQLICHQNRADINEINWGLEKKNKLIIDFKREVDINRILTEFNNSNLNNLNGKPIQIETVNKTKTLVVLIKGNKMGKKKQLDQDGDDYVPQSIPATKDLIDLYFLNKQRSGGGEIESIERKTSRYWLVKVKDYRVMKDILARKHMVDEKPLKIFPYYDNFGLPYLFKPIFDDHNTQSSMNTTFKLKLRDDRLRHFGKVKNLHKKMNEILSEANAVSRYNKQDNSILYVNYIDKLVTKVPFSERIWRLKVSEGIEYFLHIYKFEKLTLSFNQWSTISKTKQLNEAFFDSFKAEDIGDDSQSVTGSTYGSDIKYISGNCAIINVNDTGSNVEINIVGENSEVDKFIVKIKDVICKAYFTFELEEKIMKFKTYLFECEELLSKWLIASKEGDSDLDSIDQLSVSDKKGESGLKLNKSRRHTIDEFLSKLERDHLDMELSYGKLFQELGYNFLSHTTDDQTDENESEYKVFNYRLSSSLDEYSESGSKLSGENESQMDKIKYTLDDLRARINVMRKKFRQYTIRMKRTVNSTKQNLVDSSDEGEETELDEDDENEELLKLCVLNENQGKVLTFKVHPLCKIRELKKILYNKCGDERYSIENLMLNFNKAELSNESYTLEDYNIYDGCTITMIFDEF